MYVGIILVKLMETRGTCTGLVQFGSIYEQFAQSVCFSCIRFGFQNIQIVVGKN